MIHVSIIVSKILRILPNLVQWKYPIPSSSRCHAGIVMNVCMWNILYHAYMWIYVKTCVLYTSVEYEIHYDKNVHNCTYIIYGGMYMHSWDLFENSIKKAHLKPLAPTSAVETRHPCRSHWRSQLSHFGFNNFAQIRKVLIQIPDSETNLCTMHMVWWCLMHCGRPMIWV